LGAKGTKGTQKKGEGVGRHLQRSLSTLRSGPRGDHTFLFLHRRGAERGGTPSTKGGGGINQALEKKLRVETLTKSIIHIRENY